MTVIHLRSRQPLATAGRLHNRRIARLEEEGEAIPGWTFLTPLFAGFVISALMWAMRP